MSNLSELLPAGAGAKSAQFVASGTLSSGQTVVLNSDGTVEAVVSDAIPQELGSAVVFETGATSFISATFDSNANKVVIAYRDTNNSFYGTAVVGTVSGTSISFGTPVVFQTENCEYISAVFDSGSNTVVIAYREDDGGVRSGNAIVGTVSGTSISFGTLAFFQPSNHNIAHVSVTYDSNEGKVVIAYSDVDNSYYGTAIVGTVSGTSISFGSKVVFESASTFYTGSTFDSNSNKVVIAYQDNSNSSANTAVVGTVSGTSISFGTPVVYATGTSTYHAITFDSGSNKVVINYSNISNSRYATAVVGEVSGTSLSFGSPVVYNSASTEYTALTYDSNAGKIVSAYRNDASGRVGTAIVGTVSGTSISFGSPFVFEPPGSNWNSLTFDSNSKKVVIAYNDEGNSDKGTAIVLQNESSNAPDFIGITDQAIADTATGAVIVQGGVSEKVTGLTTGSDYYVQANGTLSTTVSSVPAGRALSSTSILLEG